MIYIKWQALFISISSGPKWDTTNKKTNQKLYSLNHSRYHCLYTIYKCMKNWIDILMTKHKYSYWRALLFKSKSLDRSMMTADIYMRSSPCITKTAVQNWPRTWIKYQNKSDYFGKDIVGMHKTHKAATIKSVFCCKPYSLFSNILKLIYCTSEKASFYIRCKDFFTNTNNTSANQALQLWK